MIGADLHLIALAEAAERRCKHGIDVSVDRCTNCRFAKEETNMATVKYPEVKVQLSDEDGNAFAIMGAVSKALRRAGVPQDEIDAYLAESKSGDYDHLIQTAMRWVETT